MAGCSAGGAGNAAGLAAHFAIYIAASAALAAILVITVAPRAAKFSLAPAGSAPAHLIAIAAVALPVAFAGAELAFLVNISLSPASLALLVHTGKQDKHKHSRCAYTQRFNNAFHTLEF